MDIPVLQCRRTPGLLWFVVLLVLSSYGRFLFQLDEMVFPCGRLHVTIYNLVCYVSFLQGSVQEFSFLYYSGRSGASSGQVCILLT